MATKRSFFDWQKVKNGAKDRNEHPAQQFPEDKTIRGSKSPNRDVHGQFSSVNQSPGKSNKAQAVTPRSADSSHDNLTVSEDPGAEHPSDDTVDTHSTSRLLSPSSLDNLAYCAPESELANLSPAHFAQVVLKLRRERDELRKAKIPPRTSSHANSITGRTGENRSNVDPVSITSNRSVRQQEELEAARRELSRLKLALQQEEYKHANTEKLRKQAANALASAIRTDPSILDDKDFKERVVNFRYNIQHWVRNQTWKTLGINAQIERDLRKALSFLEYTCPQYLDYVGSQRSMEVLIEAHVWQFLAERVFGENIWATTAEENEANQDESEERPSHNIYTIQKHKLDQSVNDEAMDLRHAWRSASARLLAARNPAAVDEVVWDAIQDVASDLEYEVNLLAEKSLDLPSLRNLFRDAVKLDAIIQQQRPHYSFLPVFRSTKWKRGFSSSSMDIYGDDGKQPLPKEHQPIKLVLNPSFRKSGDLAGRNYNRATLLLNMVVDI